MKNIKILQEFIDSNRSELKYGQMTSPCECVPCYSIGNCDIQSGMNYSV
jgi:hypothetical protein